MALDRRLLDLLACPLDKGPLYYFEAEGFLYNARLKKKYRVEADVPQLIVDEATSADAAEHSRLLEVARRLGLSENFSTARPL